MNKLEASEIEAIFEENESAFEFAEALDESTIFKTLSPDAKANISK